MRNFYVPAGLVFVALLAACSDQKPRGFGSPIPVTVPSMGDVSGPRFASAAGGPLVLSWMERKDRGATLRSAEFRNGGFDTVVTVVEDPLMFVNWADLPSVTALGDDRWIAHWLRYSARKTYSYDVVVSQSFDDRETWSEPMAAHTDGTQTEHGFVSVERNGDGATLLWLDGRNTPDRSMTLRSAVITPDGSRIQEQEVDDSVCDCCQTDIAVSARGLLAVYRDRTADEIRDIYITRHNGERWLAGKRLFADNWKIPGCPVNGPSIVADDDFVAVAWFSAANDRPIVRVVMSTDGGEQFGPPVEVATGRVFGYVGLAQLDDRHLAVSWVGGTIDGRSPVYVRTVDTAGTTGPVLEVGTTKQLRVFPQLAVSENQVIVVWTDDIDDGRIMKAAAIPWHGT